MMRDDDLVKKKLIALYRNINKKNWEIVVLVGIVLCIVLDILPFKYWPIAERIFVRTDDDYNRIPALILVVWTFTTALIIFWMGRMQDRRYGIRLIESFIQGLAEDRRPYAKLVRMFAAFVVELAAVFLATLYEWNITLTVLTAVQILTMMYVFLMICVESSQDIILERIRQSTIDYIQGKEGVKQGDGVNYFFARMIDCTDYKDEKEVNGLTAMIVEIVQETSVKKTLDVQWFMNSCIDHIIKMCDDRDIVTNLVKDLLMRLDQEEHIYAKRGIFLSVMENEYRENSPSVREIADTRFKDWKQVIAAGLAYSGYYSLCRSNRNVGKRPANEVYKYLWGLLGEEELEIIFDIWRTLSYEEQKDGQDALVYWNLDKLWEIVTRKENDDGKRSENFNAV